MKKSLASWCCWSWTGLLAAAMVVPISAAEYHVAPSGSDQAAGTAAAPFRTIQRAADILQPGDTCLIQPGVYAQAIRPANSGLPGKPITFAAATTKPLITGTEAVANWTVHQGKIHKARISAEPQQVLVDGVMMVAARYPNDSGDPWKPNLLPLGIENGRVTGRGLDQPADFWKGGHIWGLDNRLGWVAQTRKIASSSPGSVITDTAKSWWGTGGGRAYLSGVLGALDAPGEWHAQEGWLYLWLPDGGDPNQRQVAITQRRFAFDLADRAHIHIRNVRLLAASINLDKAQHCLIDGLEARHVSFERNLAGGFNRDRSISPAAEGLGIVLAGSNNAVINSIISHNTGDGVSIFGSDNRVENCIIHDCNTSGSDCAPITCTGAGHAILGNTLYNGGRSIVVHRKLQRGRIERNHMYNAGLLTNDMGMTYTYQTDGQGTVIAWNIIHHNFGHGYGCVGIYLDDMSSNHIVHHNIVYQVSEALALNPPKSLANQIYNNTLDGFRCSIGMSTRRPQDMTGTQIRNNIFTNRIPAALPGATLADNLMPETDPRFVDRARGDYRLRADSPARDGGAAVPPWTDGFAGPKPDCGALEHGREPWKAGSTVRPPEGLRNEDLSIAARKWDAERRANPTTRP